ncbi:hypothetical protein SAMN05444354_109236 [Stigmatella aurantiaca]|uniref:Uncharacterized protein n=1 Tax=Stigmatella aurantiaca TaxID=41 RepID=A0A1H7U041_STIAU|nr:hypothetical protein [Stigmatella aurantiaca]SEL90026.1 hypothetical protein SAMN05444354_109236 [Stigmatella aurantiaca]
MRYGIVVTLNTAQGVTPTKGCAALGVDPHNCGVEYALVKVVDDMLLVGVRPADGSGPCTAAKRTSTGSDQ